VEKVFVLNNIVVFNIINKMLRSIKLRVINFPRPNEVAMIFSPEIGRRSIDNNPVRFISDIISSHRVRILHVSIMRLRKSVR